MSVPEIGQTGLSFGDRLAHAVGVRESAIVVGLDPDPMRLWQTGAGEQATSSSPVSAAANAVSTHCRLVLDAVGDACVGVKLQSASFERLGAPGIQAMSEVVRHASDIGLLVIADVKRGDIDKSATSYAQALFGETQTPWGPVPGLGVDAATVAPYMGIDSITPFIEAADSVQGGVFVLVRTSNPGSSDIQEQTLGNGEPIWTLTARIVNELGNPASGSKLANLGAVVGATAAPSLTKLRELMPKTPWLIPGVGAQGGAISDLGPAFEPGPGAALVTVSRALVGETAGPATQRAQAARKAAENYRQEAAKWL